jgi:hypothetical protein
VSICSLHGLASWDSQNLSLALAIIKGRFAVRVKKQAMSTSRRGDYKL